MNLAENIISRSDIEAGSVAWEFQKWFVSIYGIEDAPTVSLVVSPTTTSIVVGEMWEYCAWDSDGSEELTLDNLKREFTTFALKLRQVVGR